jgi:hypothetical protein
MNIKYIIRNFIIVTTAAFLVNCFSPTVSLGAEPKPGDVINSGNVEQYKDYFPNTAVQNNLKTESRFL